MKISFCYCIWVAALLVGPMTFSSPASAAWLNNGRDVFVKTVAFRPIGSSSNKMLIAELDQNYVETGSLTCRWIRWHQTNSGWDELTIILTQLISAKLSGVPVRVYIETSESGNNNTCQGGQLILGELT